MKLSYLTDYTVKYNDIIKVFKHHYDISNDRLNQLYYKITGNYANANTPVPPCIIIILAQTVNHYCKYLALPSTNLHYSHATAYDITNELFKVKYAKPCDKNVLSVTTIAGRANIDKRCIVPAIRALRDLGGELFKGKLGYHVNKHELMLNKHGILLLANYIAYHQTCRNVDTVIKLYKSYNLANLGKASKPEHVAKHETKPVEQVPVTKPQATVDNSLKTTIKNLIKDNLNLNKLPLTLNVEDIDVTLSLTDKDNHKVKFNINL